MQSSTIVTVVWVLASGSDAAFNLVKPRGFSSPIESSLIRSATPKLRKRDTIGLDMGTIFEGFQYFVNFTVGTPPQSVSATFDTGSSNLILNSATSDFCTSANPSPCLGGAFNVNSSSTVKQVGTDMISVYEVAGYEGNWYTDTVAFGGKSIENFTMGVADTFSNGTTNTLGVSFVFPQNFTLGTANPSPDNSLGQMVKAGLIPSSTYSIWMDRNSALGGTVLLGGVDTSKFTGELQSYPIVPSDPASGIYVRLALSFSASVGGSKPIAGNSSDFPAIGTLDSGNPNMLLPTSLVTNIYSTYGVQPLSLPGGATFGVCSCGLANSTATLDISFPGLKISIPFSDLVIDPTAELYAGFNIPPSIRLPNGTCLFMVSPTREGFGNIIGDNFLRYAYYVVDLDSHQIGLAASNPKPGKSNIMEIAAGTSALPSPTGAAAAQTGSGTATGNGGSSPTSSGQPSSTTKLSAGNRLSGVDFGVMVGIVGLAFML
ncbi:acid protease [Stipitochalara longipes BDJ]|nr:acid protease [Stipitochalara longipes BDJ]